VASDEVPDIGPAPSSPPTPPSPAPGVNNTPAAVVPSYAHRRLDPYLSRFNRDNSNSSSGGSGGTQKHRASTSYSATNLGKPDASTPAVGGAYQEQIDKALLTGLSLNQLIYFLQFIFSLSMLSNHENTRLVLTLLLTEHCLTISTAGDDLPA